MEIRFTTEAQSAQRKNLVGVLFTTSSSLAYLCVLCASVVKRISICDASPFVTYLHRERTDPASVPLWQLSLP
jgi:hypothetical protein